MSDMLCSYGNINKKVNTRLFTRKSPLSILNRICLSCVGFERMESKETWQNIFLSILAMEELFKPIDPNDRYKGDNR